MGIVIAAGTASNVGGSSGPVGPSATFAVTNSVPRISISGPSTYLAEIGIDSSITYTVTYTSATTVTLAAAKITLNKTGTANGIVSVTGAGSTTRTVSITGISGDGTLGISIATGTATNPIGSAGAAGPSATFYVVDPSMPPPPPPLD